MKKKLLIISFSNLQSDPRVRRQIEAFRKTYNVTCIGYNDPGYDNVIFYSIPKGGIKRYTDILFKLVFRFFENYYWNSPPVKNTQNNYCHLFKITDCVIANDIDSLPVALKCTENKVPVIFDAHEYSPLEFEDSLLLKFLFQTYKTQLCEQYIPLSNEMMTVSPGLLDRYQKDTGKQIHLVTNACQYVEQSDWQVPEMGDKIRLIHHGGARSSRKLELMIEMMNYIDSRFELTLMLMPSDKRYLKRLMNLSSGLPVNFIEPVSFKDIIDEISQYDIGVYILYPGNFNNLNALPNKIFEFVQARLACAIAPSPDMKNLVEHYELGVVAQDFEPQSLANCLNNLTSDNIKFYRQQAHKFADELSSKSNEKILHEIVKSVL